MIAGIGGDFADVALTGSLALAIPVAIIAGLVSFASPCVVPLVPSYLGYVSGMAGSRDGKPGSRPRLVLGVLLFILGFTAVFVTLGVVVATAGAQLSSELDVVTRVLGAVIVVLGFAFVGSVPFLQRERRIHVNTRAGLAGAPVLGIAFGLGWTPCIGPTLSAVLALSLNEGTQVRGAILALFYCLGLGLPFLLVALTMERSDAVLRWMRRHRLALMRTGGAMLMVLGMLLLTGLWQALTTWMQGWISDFWVAI